MFWILLGGEGSERPGGWGGMGFGRKVGLDWMGKGFFFPFSPRPHSSRALN